MEFEFVGDVGSALEEELVLAGEFCSEGRGKDFEGGFAEEFFFGLGTAATGEGLVDDEVAGSGVFDEVDGVGNAVEELAAQVGLGELVEEWVMGFRWCQGGTRMKGIGVGGNSFVQKGTDDWSF